MDGVWEAPGFRLSEGSWDLANIFLRVATIALDEPFEMEARR